MLPHAILHRVVDLSAAILNLQSQHNPRSSPRQPIVLPSRFSSPQSQLTGGLEQPASTHPGHPRGLLHASPRHAGTPLRATPCPCDKFHPHDEGAHLSRPGFLLAPLLTSPRPQVVPDCPICPSGIQVNAGDSVRWACEMESFIPPQAATRSQRSWSPPTTGMEMIFVGPEVGIGLAEGIGGFRSNAPDEGRILGFKGGG